MQTTRKAKMSKVAELNWKPDCNVPSLVNDIKTQLKDINHKLANVAPTVDRSIEKINTNIKQLLEKDATRMTETMKDLLSGIKDEIVKELLKHIEVLESRIFERKTVKNDQFQGSSANSVGGAGGQDGRTHITTISPLCLQKTWG
ncbi:hypothetical protein DPMN_074310 [Dreissena polymorpha]|uniref:Uncharacterized protein n=1 Tax=Dreissena polymorpha TaxID=45954 RepID=A0A9D3YID2_DREPO|nr:hypothetical protein DPMN_074310 [Dreissena polymorpha]